jgi:hypothetical protein
MIVIIFILKCLNLINLELRIFYNYILGIEKKYCLWRHISFMPYILKVQKFTLKLF